MFRFGRRRFRSTDSWTIVAIFFALLLLAGILVVNIVGQGYEQQTFRSSTYNQSSPSFPANFLRGSLKDQSSCDAEQIRQGDGKCPSAKIFFFFSRINIFSVTDESVNVPI